ncbi:MAG: hypothetical protein OEY89_02475 [Gammaproteobacteria bacterium]|nr:hypothetical protein [Gammaproteobacteria bacterium]
MSQITITITKSHGYKVNGVKYPSVTQLIKRAGLDPNAKFYNPEDAKRGVAVHKLTEKYDLHLPIDKDVANLYSGYFKAYRTFIKMCAPIWDIDGIEQSFFNAKYKYCGTRDRVGSIMWAGKRCRAVVDIKTGCKAYWHGIQIAGYTLDERYCRERFSLYLNKNGRYQLERYTDDGEYNVFLSILPGGK